MFVRYDITAGTREARGETKARETSKWDILDHTS